MRQRIEMKKRYKGSYTLEAAIYVPIILSIVLQTLEIAINYCQESKEREVCAALQQLDILSEFYGYQIIDEVKEEISDD